jgi:NNP family nitrate/nitrite transporter-like MFS transporter
VHSAWQQQSGWGTGRVFKLVPEYFPQSVGSVTGLVGAAEGLGGFLPPLLIGGVHQLTGAFTLGFILLSIFALACLFVLWKVGTATTSKVVEVV